MQSFLVILFLLSVLWNLCALGGYSTLEKKQTFAHHFVSFLLTASFLDADTDNTNTTNHTKKSLKNKWTRRGHRFSSRLPFLWVGRRMGMWTHDNKQTIRADTVDTGIQLQPHLEYVFLAGTGTPIRTSLYFLRYLFFPLYKQHPFYLLDDDSPHRQASFLPYLTDRRGTDDYRRTSLLLICSIPLIIFSHY